MTEILKRRRFGAEIWQCAVVVVVVVWSVHPLLLTVVFSPAVKPLLVGSAIWPGPWRRRNGAQKTWGRDALLPKPAACRWQRACRWKTPRSLRHVARWWGELNGSRVCVCVYARTCVCVCVYGRGHRWSHSNIRTALCYIKEQC